MGEETIALNRRARHEFTIEDTFEAGLVLTGTEIKSIRAGKVNLADAYARIDKGEAWLVGAHIAPWAERQPLQPRAEARPRSCSSTASRSTSSSARRRPEGPDDRPAASSTSASADGPRSSSAWPAASSSTTDGATSPIAMRGATSTASWPTSAGVGADGQRSR